MFFKEKWRVLIPQKFDFWAFTWGFPQLHTISFSEGKRLKCHFFLALL